jgi:phage FluMu protein Com
MAINSDTVKCGKCGQELIEPTSTPFENRVPCPHCGSFSRAYFASIHETTTIREKIGMKGKRGGTGKPFIETVSGDDLLKTTGKWNKLERVIDRENNLYSEKIIDPETGKIIYQCEEPLSEHKGHGSAKKKK